MRFPPAFSSCNALIAPEMPVICFLLSNHIHTYPEQEIAHRAFIRVIVHKCKVILLDDGLSVLYGI